MEAGKILVTFKKEVFERECGSRGIPFAKQIGTYRGETPKTITFIATETTPKKEILNLLLYKVRSAVKAEDDRQRKYIGKTVIDVA